MKTDTRALLVCTAIAVLLNAPARAAPVWAVDPQGVGEQLPPVGRSLFDFLVSKESNGQRIYDVPFPYTALVERIEQRLQGAGYRMPQVKQVLIPLGRSLQRNAAAPDFFRFPRVVAVVDTEAGPRGDRQLLLKDRLYIGFGEKSAVLEVISYNEAAGRFEFQVVNDYRPGGTPRVAYADRAVCMSCHQNAAPIFSRQNWDETNANPRIAALLRAHGDAFHGVSMQRGVDVPFAIDEASDRANLFAVTQLLWREGCGAGEAGARCRAGVFGLALQYRLSGDRVFDAESLRARQDVAAVLAARWARRWPDGLYIPDADLPNRDPLITAAPHPAQRVSFNPALDGDGKQLLSDLLANTDVRGPFEPLEPRAPLETWYGADAQSVMRFVRGVAEFIAINDARVIDAQLQRNGNAAAHVVPAPCEVTTAPVDATETRLVFTCSDAEIGKAFAVSGRVYLRGRAITRGTVDALVLDGAELRGLEVAPGAALARSAREWTLSLQLTQSGLRVHTATGAAVRSLLLRGTMPLPTKTAAGASIVANVTDDFAAVWNALDGLLRAKDGALSDEPLRRSVLLPALLAHLGKNTATWCCVDARHMPPAVDDRTLSPVQATSH